MSKVRRGGARTTSKGRRGADRRQSKSQSSGSGRKLSNWAAAHVRAARHRASYALRLAAMAMAALTLGALGLAALFGRLDDAGASLVASAENQLEDAGYALAWLDIAGAERTQPEDIAAMIGAAPGRGLTEFDPETARAALEALSWVEHAQVFRLWPDRVAVVLTERQPYALWQFEQVHRVIDRSGVVIEAADPLEFADLPHLVGAGANTAAAEILTLLGHHDAIAERTTHAVRVGERRWSLRLRSGGDVLLPAEDPASALALLAAMHAERGVLDYDAQILDLRNAGEMVMRPWPERVASAGRGA